MRLGAGRPFRYLIGGQLRGEQVGEHHRAGEIRHVSAADAPSVPGPADNRVFRHRQGNGRRVGRADTRI
jgi:hypothetical protein